ncbi:MAG: hypothetical protein AB1817_14870 [Chloroflexota bacterium]
MQTPTITIENIETELKQLPAKRLKQVLLFVQFLEHIERQGLDVDDVEDNDLWNAVLAHQKYRAEHPGERAEIFDSAEAFLRATAD